MPLSVLNDLAKAMKALDGKKKTTPLGEGPWDGGASCGHFFPVLTAIAVWRFRRFNLFLLFSLATVVQRTGWPSTDFCTSWCPSLSSEEQIVRSQIVPPPLQGAAPILHEIAWRSQRWRHNCCLIPNATLCRNLFCFVEGAPKRFLFLCSSHKSISQTNLLSIDLCQCHNLQKQPWSASQLADLTCTQVSAAMSRSSPVWAGWFTLGTQHRMAKSIAQLTLWPSYRWRNWDYHQTFEKAGHKLAGTQKFCSSILTMQLANYINSPFGLLGFVLLCWCVLFVFGVLVFGFVSFCALVMTLWQYTGIRIGPSPVSLLRPLNRRRPTYAIINQLIPIYNMQ